MKLGTFFDKFDKFADAPGAVAKMRELVLELSATGRLIPEALERPVEEDTKLMGAIVELVMGQAPAGAECNTEGRGTVFVKVGEFGPLYPREEVWTTNPLKFAKKGDVLVCVVGATVGKLNLAIDCAIGRSVAAIRPSVALDTKFLYYSLIPYTLRLRGNSRGSAQGVIGKAELSAVSIWVPRRETQKRIVAKVDELMALCDRLETLQKEKEFRLAGIARASLARFADAPTPANLPFLFHPAYSLAPAELRNAILRQAFLGRMRWEPRGLKADRSHLSRLQIEHHQTWNRLQLAAFQEKKVVPKNDAWMKRYVAPDFPNSADLPDIPEHWAWIPLELACPTIVDSPHRTPVYADSGEYPALRPRDVAGGVLKLKQAARVEMSEYERQTERRKPQCGDIVYSRELSFGWAVILPEEPRICLSQGMVSLQTASEVDANFLCKLLNSPIVRDQAETAAIGAAHPHVNLKDIRVFTLPLPPLAEQRRIVTKVEQLMALVDTLEKQLAVSRATSANLLSALVAELTTQKGDGNET